MMELEQARGVQSGHQIAMLESQIGIAKHQQEMQMKQAELLMKAAASMKEEPQQ
jgi:hypothetical protein